MSARNLESAVTPPAADSVEDGRQEARWKVLLAKPDRSASRHLDEVLSAAGFVVMRPVRTVSDATSLLTAGAPDVIVMDFLLSEDVEAFGVLSTLATERRVPIVFLSSSTNAETVGRVAESFGCAFLLRPYSEAQLVATVILATISAKRPAISRSSTQTAAERLRAIALVLEEGARQPHQGDDAEVLPVGEPVGLSGATSAGPSDSTLSPREREIVDLLGHGARVASVAAQLGLSTHTVRNHLKSIYRKLRLRGQHELYDYQHRGTGPGSPPTPRLL